MKHARLWLAALVLLAGVAPGLAQAPPTPPPISQLGGSAALSVSAVSSRIALPANIRTYSAVTLLNDGSTKAYFALGDATVTATVSSTPLASGQSMTVWVGANTYVAAITASSTTTVTVYQANGPLSLRGIGSGSGGLAVGTTAIAGGTNGNVLYDNGGVLGELALVGLAHGGTGANLSATGGASQVLRQSSAGGAITVSQLAQADISGLTTADAPTFAGLTLTGGTVTASTPILNGTQTWNAGAVAFTGLQFNVTDTASSASSLLLDLQIGGTSKFKVAKDGSVVAAGSISAGPTNAGQLWIDGATKAHGFEYYLSKLGFRNGSSAWSVGFGNILGGNGNAIATISTGVIGFVNGTDVYSGTIDALMTRSGAATLQFGAADAAAPVAQSLQVQSVVGGTTNTAGVDWSFNASRGTGTGAGGKIIFNVAPAGTTGTAQNALAAALTLNSDQSAIFAGAIGVQGAPASVYADAVNLGANSGLGKGTGNPRIVQNSYTVAEFSSAAGLGINPASTTGSGYQGASLIADAAGILAQRNGTNAQAFRVYNTYTDASNYERFKIEWTGSWLYMGTEAAGTGTQRGLNLNGSIVNIRTGALDRWQFDALGYLKPIADNTYDLGTSSLRPRNIYVGTNFIVPGGATAVLKSAAAITSGAGVATGTLTNAPTAGNPTSWIPINDNGTTRYIPAW